jgi:hypothetical protein
LIKSFNGSSSSTALGNWLATTLPDLFSGLQGRTNSQVVTYSISLFNSQSQKTYAQVLATALNVYATDNGLGGSAAKSYGFTVDSVGLATSTYNVGSNGQAIGLSNNTSYSVLFLLEQTDSLTTNGVIKSSASNAVYSIFLAINQAGGIS